MARPVSVHWLPLFALVAGGYALGSELAYSWFGADGTSASFFPAAGVTFAALALVPKRQWPIVLAAAGLAELALDLLHGIDAVAALGYVTANLAQPLVGAALLTTLLARRVDIGRTRDLTAFVTAGVVVGPAVGAVVGASAYVLLGDGDGWLRFAGQWWVGDGLGVLVIGGAILSMWASSAHLLTSRRAVEGVLFAALGVLASLAVLRLDWFAFVYVPIALLVVTAFRVGTRGVAPMGALIAIAVAEATAEGHTFWDSLDISPPTALVYLQLGMGVVIVSALALASEISERERMARALARTEADRATANERAALYDSERSARRRVEQLQQRTSDLQAVTAELAAANSTKDVARVTVARYIPLVGGLGGSVFVLDDENGVLRMVEHGSYPTDIIDAYRVISLDEQLPAAEAARTGQAVLIRDASEMRARYPHVAETLELDDPAYGRAWADIPLLAGGRTVGMLLMAFPQPQPFDAAQRTELDAGADAIAQALQRAGLYERERRARERAELLERHAAHLAAAETAEQVAQATVDELSQAGVEIAVVTVVSDGVVRALGGSGLPDLALQNQATMSLDTPAVVTETIRSGVPVVVRSGEEYDRRFPEFAGFRSLSGVESVIAVPLRAAEGRVLGALVASSRAPDWIDTWRHLMLDALATQCGLALERAQLRARVQADTATAQLLSELGELLERETTAEARAHRVVDLLVASDAEHATVEIDAETRFEVRAGDLNASAGARLVSLPLRARGRTLGTLTVALPPRGGSDLGGFDLRAVAERAAVAIDNALLYERERDVSHSLQMNLLGTMGSPSAGVELASAYLPGTATLDVGGDWCDAFELPDGRLAFAVGDVVGHGLEAAMAMGQLRGAVRALAPIGRPVEVLRNLDAFVASVPEAVMATLAYAELDLVTGQLVYAAAGHPPPLLAAPSTRARLLWDGRSAPLGSADAVGREEAEVVLGPDELLLLYTDGLIERRSEGVDTMLERLVAAAKLSSDDSPQDVVERVLKTMLDGDAQADDVCVLALTRARDRFRRALPASEGEVGALRHALRAWLVEREVDEETSRDVVLAVSEASANAVEHGYAFDGVGIVEVEVRVDQASLTVTVSDTGGWRTPPSCTDRGRGTTIMRTLMDDLVTEGDTHGTIVRMRKATPPSVPA